MAGSKKNKSKYELVCKGVHIYHGARGDTLKIDCWDSIANKQHYEFVKIPVGMGKVEIKNYALSILVDMQKGIDCNIPYISPKKTLSDYFYDNFVPELERSNRSPLTITGYKSRFKKHIEPIIGHLKFTSVNYIVIQKMHTRLVDDGVPEQTRASIQRTISAIYGSALKKGLVKVNPATGSGIARSVHIKPKDAVEKKDLKTIINHLQIDNVSTRCDVPVSIWSVVYGLLIFTGARRGEILALTWEDIYLDDPDGNNYIDINKDVVSMKKSDAVLKGSKNIVVKDPKTKYSKRRVWIGAPIVDLLRKYREESISIGFVFKGTNNLETTLYPDTLTAHFSTICSKCAIDGISIQALRRSVETYLDILGVRKQVRNAILGHSGLDVGDKHYNCAFNPEIRIALEKYYQFVLDH